jgi:choline dehydrogenase-like flavoprotein
LKTLILRSDQQEDFITIPLLYGNFAALGSGTHGTKYDWNLTSTPQAQLNSTIVNLPAGKVIGGGTVLNGMNFDRGSEADYDRWEVLGNEGWSWQGLLPYFKKARLPCDTIGRK